LFLDRAAVFGALGEDVALIDPALHADAPKRGVRLGDAVVDVRAERVARHAALGVGFAARHLGPAEAARDGDAHADGAALHGPLHRLLDRAAEGDAPFELVRDGARHEVGVEFRRADLLDVHAHAAAGEALQRIAELFHLRAAAADDDARFGGVDRDR